MIVNVIIWVYIRSHKQIIGKKIIENKRNTTPKIRILRIYENNMKRNFTKKFGKLQL